MKKYLCLWIFSTSILVHAAESTPTACFPLSSGIGRYCVYKPTTGHNRDVLFYFHGHLYSEQTWDNDAYFTKQIQNYWQEQHMSPPTVVSISYGFTWLLAEPNTSPYSGLFAIFTKQDLPAIEKQIGRHRRILLGESMGGLNAIQLTLKTNLFQKVAILCPPVANGVTPFSSQTELDSYVTNSKAFKYYKESDPNLVAKSVAEMVTLATAFYPTPADWQKADPIALARSQGMKVKAEVYLSSGFYDRYAAFDGTTELADILKDQGIKLEWRPLWGGHCAVDIPSVARFLVRH